MSNNFYTPKQLLELVPLEQEELLFIQRSKALAKDILHGQNGKKVLIIGPCSIHSYKAALKYAHRLKLLQQKIDDKLLLIMRCFIEKPRTKTDWKGFLYDPYLDNSSKIEEGIFISRQLFTEITKLNVPIAMEFLDPLSSIFFQDLVTWGFIGARTCTSQPHRQLASSLDMPVGFKNPLDGSIDHAIHSISFSQYPHTFLHTNQEGQMSVIRSPGNFHTHLVLRGSKDRPNYDLVSLNEIRSELRNSPVSTKIMVDCAHDNSRKSLEKQKEVFRELSQHMSQDADIFGLMLESNLLRGSQSIKSTLSEFNENISVTDPCLGWEETEELIMYCYQLLSKGSSTYVGSLNSSSLLNAGSS